VYQVTVLLQVMLTEDTLQILHTCGSIAHARTKRNSKNVDFWARLALN